MRRSVLALIAILSWTTLMYAATTGSIRGTVRDPSGALISNAQVTVVNQATNETRSFVTDASGSFQFLLLPVGDYTLKVEHPGFKTSVLKNIHLTVNQVASFDVQMQLGELVSTVEVQANPAQVDTTATQVGAVIDTQPIVDLPLNGRNLYQLAALQPGITVPAAADANNPIFAFRQVGAPLVYSSGGGRLVMNNFMVDGGDTNGIIENQAVIRIIPDAVQEFRVITNTYNAEYGRNAGSVVNLVTRSGGNSWHGTLFEFLRNDVLNARGYFEVQKASFKQNQFGGTLGGPLHKDQTFFFFSYQGTRNRQGVSGIAQTVFSNQERGGSFSDRDPAGFTGALKDPLCFPRDATSSPNCFAAGTAYSTIFPNATIPTSFFNPVAANILNNLIPPPNVGANTLAVSPVQPDDDDRISLRLDHQLSRKQKLSGLWYFEDNKQINAGTSAGNIPGFPVVTPERDQQINLSHTYVISPTTLNEARLSYVRQARSSERNPLRVASPASFGFSGIQTGQPANLQSLPVIDIAGGPQFGTQGFGSGGGRNVSNVYQFADNFSKIHGHHSLRFGADYRYIQFTQEEVFIFDGDFFLGGAGRNSTGDPFADFLLGLPDSYTQGSASYERLHEHQVNLYAQDTWQIRPNLTLNYGLRWELNTPFVDKADAISVFRFPLPGQPAQQSTVFPTAPPGLLFPADKGVPRGMANTYYKSFAPRIGVAYSPSWLGPNKLVIRTAYGIFYNPIEQSVLLQFNGDPPYGGSSFVAAPGFAQPFTDQTGFTNPSPFPFVPPNRGDKVNFNSFFPIFQFGNLPPDLRNQYLEQYNLLLEYQLSPTTVVSGGYVGSQGHRLLATYDANAGNPQLCLQLSSQKCGPFAEGSTYTLSGTTYFSTRPAGVFSNNGASAAFGSIFTQVPIAASSYNSLQIRMDRRSKDLQYQLSYTWSKSIDNASGFENELNPFCFRCDRTLSGFDARHRFVFSSIYELPFGRMFGASDVTKKLIDGWEIGGIYTFQSGVPVRLTDSVSDNSLTGGFSFETADRPDIVGPIARFDPHHQGCQAGTSGSNCVAVPNQFFDPNAFAFEQLGTIGNAKHNMFAGPRINNLDASIIKRTQIRESLSAEFRAEFFNFLNHTQFLNPNGDIGAGKNFGRITGARDPRFIQFATKLTF